MHEHERHKKIRVKDSDIGSARDIQEQAKHEGRNVGIDKEKLISE
jgi:hypothetical protein